MTFREEFLESTENSTASKKLQQYQTKPYRCQVQWRAPTVAFSEHQRMEDFFVCVPKFGFNLYIKKNFGLRLYTCILLRSYPHCTKNLYWFDLHNLESTSSLHNLVGFFTMSILYYNKPV